MHLLFDVPTFVLDNYSHYLVVGGIEALLDILQPNNRSLHLVLVLSEHFNVVHVLDFCLHVFV